MENTMNHVVGWGLVGFTCLTGGLLLVNAAQAIAGTATFAYWHLVTLAALVYFCNKMVSWVMIARAAVWIRKTRKQTASVARRSILDLTRAARGLAALFTQRNVEIKGSRR